MMNDLTLTTPADDAELAPVLDVVSQALHFPRDLADRFAGIVGREHFRALRRGSTTLGGLALHMMGQHFGGRSVPMGGVGAVGIGTEHRAGGAATDMMKLAMRDLHQRGVPISTLYPATVTLYRRAGYELAGSRYEIVIPIRQMRPAADGKSLRVERATEADRPAIEALYRRASPSMPGSLERGQFSWKRVYEPRGEKASGFKAVNARGEIEGYLYLLQKDGDAPGAPAHGAHRPIFHLLIGDVQFETPAAGARLLEMLRQHQSVCESAALYGSPDHPLLALLPERCFEARHQFHWMLRIVHVEKALAARGWSPALHGEVSLDVQDDVLPENNARFTLRVGDSRAEVSRGGSGDVVIDIRGLAALYTGHLSPHELIKWGRLRVADHVRDPARTLATLEGLFAGPRPWLADMF